MSTSSKQKVGRNALERAGQVVVAYLGASVIETIVFSEGMGGHADVPFTQFPGYLLWTPLVPGVVLIDMFEQYSSLHLVSTGIFVVCFIASWVAYGRWRQRSFRDQS